MSRTTLPQWPERAVSHAAGHSSRGKVWVMTELTVSCRSVEVCSIALAAYQVSYISRP